MKNRRNLEKRRKGYKQKNDYDFINKMMKSKDIKGNRIEYKDDLNFPKV